MDEGTLASPSEPAVGAANPCFEAKARLGEAERYRQAKLLDKAKAICTELLREHPEYVGALLTLGLSQAEGGEYEAARINLTRATMLNPRDWQVLSALGGVYRKLDSDEMAKRSLESAHRLNPQDASILAKLATVYRSECEYELGAATYGKALSLDPLSAAARVGLGLCLKDLGRLREMAQVLKDVINDHPDDLAALYALSQMPAKYVDIDLLDYLDRARKTPGRLPKEREITLKFARAAALDKARRHDEAWQEMVSANAKIFPVVAERLGSGERANATLLEMLRRLKPSRAQMPSRDVPCRSLFILGPSRSGKSTMERLIACLPGVKRGYENPIVDSEMRRTFHDAGLIASKWLVDLPPEFNELFCRNYLRELSERAKGAQLFTNTHPGRISDAARFALTVPGTCFVFVKRDPRDLALRTHMKRYQTGRPHTCDLKALFRYIEWYHAMMNEIAGRFPEIARVVAYEDMIADPRRSLAQVADLCGLTVPDTVDLPDIGDDRGAAEPYREAMDAALSG